MSAVAAATALLVMLTLSRCTIGVDARPEATPTTERRRVDAPTPRRWREPATVEPAAVAAWCDELARSLRHGTTLRSVVATTIPDDGGVQRLSGDLRHRLDRGASVTAACDEWAAVLEVDPTPGRDALITLAAVLSSTAGVGGNAAEPIDRFARAMRQRSSDQLERAANSAQARLSARVLTVVPLGVLALLLVTDPDVRAVITSSTGAAVVGGGLALNLVGNRWMRRIAGSLTHPGASR